MATKKKPTKKEKADRIERRKRRELVGVLLIFLSIFSLICCFNTDAFLIKPCASFIGGLFGQVGRYAMPLVLLATAILLFRSKDKPIGLRIFATASIIITISAVVHLFTMVLGGMDPTLNIKELYLGGMTWKTGGVIPGFLAGLLSKALTGVGALILFIVLLLVQLIYCTGMTISGIVTAINDRPREEKQEPETPLEERLVNHVVTKHQERRERKAQVSDFDIPVDDPPNLKPDKKKKKNGHPISPDEFLMQKQEAPVDVEKRQITMDEIKLHDLPVEEEKPESVPVQEVPPVIPVQPQILQQAQAEPQMEPLVQPQIPPENEKMKKGEAAQKAAEISEEIAKNSENSSEYHFPPISLLNYRQTSMVDATHEMREYTKLLSDALSSFGIEPHIVDVIRGPSVTRFELELDRGVKLSKITKLSDDIALSLGATGVRISAIPDKISVVGIEVPNKTVTTVYAREVIDSAAFKKSKSSLSFAVGKDISGNCIIGDISKLPHMLIAGTTGSGKSVCINSLIISLLYKAKPEEVRFIMVDPKMVELGVYNGIPHLLIPVVTDPKKAAGALQWTVTEMMRRYRLMSEEGVRDLESYNKSIANDPDQEKLPQVVVVIDELADLMLVAAKEVEESICRIAQMGRASGIHLVIATQRPSADVITGLMKANIPSRIAFAVSSAMESRIILDTQGAEKLVGKGDMLFAPLGQGKPRRVQGCFIDDDEVQAVISSIKEQCSSDYSEDIMEQIEKKAEQSGKSTESGRNASDGSDTDELLPAAVEVILETGQASVSMLQRRLKLGYARAARIVDEMEDRGIVGPFEGAKPRQLLITREQWEQMQNGTYDPNPPVEEEID